jgi:hypothetical protein
VASLFCGTTPEGGGGGECEVQGCSVLQQCLHFLVPNFNDAFASPQSPKVVTECFQTFPEFLPCFTPEYSQ